MPRLTITIDTDNAAFTTPDAPDQELAIILKNLSNAISMRGINAHSGVIRDSNGNTTGRVEFTPDAPQTIRTFADLTPDEQTRARDIAFTQLLTAVCEGAIQFDDEQNNDDLQARIDRAAQRADDMRTPWFMHEYIMDTCADDLRAMATQNAHRSLYPTTSEHVIYLGTE